MCWIIPYLRKLNKYKRHFSDHILYQYHTIFYVYHRPSKQPNNMLKKISLILDSSQKNEGSTGQSQSNSLSLLVRSVTPGQVGHSWLLLKTILCNF